MYINLKNLEKYILTVKQKWQEKTEIYFIIRALLEHKFKINK